MKIAEYKSEIISLIHRMEDEHGCCVRECNVKIDTMIDDQDNVERIHNVDFVL